MPIFRYQLDPQNGFIIEGAITAENKTVARKQIAQDYRRDTPSKAAESGFVPYHKCKLIWLDEPEYSRHAHREIDSSRGTEGREGREGREGHQPLEISDPRIGLLIRNGSPVYYTYLNSDYKNGYREGSLNDIIETLAN